MLITATRVATAKITPSKVRKLRNLCARKASSARRMVSTMVTAPPRSPVSATLRPPAAVLTCGNRVKPSSGATPNGTSLASLHLLLIRVSRLIGFRSLCLDAKLHPLLCPLISCDLRRQATDFKLHSRGWLVSHYKCHTYGDSGATEANLVANLGSQPLVPHTALSRNTQRPSSGQQRDTGPVSLAESPVQQSTLVSNPIREVDGASRHSPDYAVA